MKFNSNCNKLAITELNDGSHILEDDKNETTYILNDMMSYILCHCENMTIDQIANQVKEDYEVSDISGEELMTDIKDALQELSLNGLVTLID